MAITKQQIRKSAVVFPRATLLSASVVEEAPVDLADAGNGKVTVAAGAMIGIDIEPQAPYVAVLGAQGGATANAWKEYYVSPLPEVGKIAITLDEAFLLSRVRVVAFKSLEDFANFKNDADGGGDGPPGHVGQGGMVLPPHAQP